MKESLCILFLFLSFLRLTTAQEIVEVRYVERDQGLLDGTVYKVVRDHYGYFYLFTQSGIQRYDGTSFDDVDASVLLSQENKIADIEEVQILDDGTIHATAPSIGQNFIISRKSLRLEKLAFSGRIMFDRRKGYGVVQDDEHYAICPMKTTSIDTNNVLLTLPFLPKQIIFNDTLSYFSNDENQIYQYKNDTLSQLSIQGKLISIEGRNYVWNDNLVSRLFSDEVKQIMKLPHSDMKLALLKSDRKGNLVAGYSQYLRTLNAFYVFTPAEKLLDYKKLIVEDFKYTSDFWTDDARYKYLFVGYTAMRIMNIARGGSEIFHKLYGLKKGEFGYVIGGVDISSQGKVVFTREKKGVYSLGENGGVQPYVSEYHLNKTFVNNLKLYSSEYDGAIYKHEYPMRNRGELSYISQINSESKSINRVSVPFNTRDIFPRNRDHILCSGFSRERGIGVLVNVDFKTQKYSVLKDSLPLGTTITKIDDRYWQGTKEGVFVWDSLFQEVARFDNTQELSSKRYIKRIRVSMIESYQNYILVGSHGDGIFVLDRENLEFVKHINRNNSALSDNYIAGIIEDNQDLCWITTFNGINVLDTSLTVVKTLYDHHGLSNREFNTCAITKDTNGNIYAGSLNGLQKLTPQKILKWHDWNGLDILNVDVFDKGTSRTITVENDNEIDVYYTIDSIKINIHFPDYFKFPFQQNKVNVSGVASKHYSINEAFITLYNLPKGVQNIRISNDENNFSQVIKINVTPDYRFLYKLLFGTLILCVVSFCIMLYYKSREKRISEYNKRIAELRLSSLQAQMNPHFMFNALGAIQYFISTHDSDKAEDYLSDFAMLMRKILEASKSKFVLLEEDIQMLRLYVGLEKVRFEHRFDYEFIIEDEVDFNVKIPPMVVQPFVENAINHGLFNLKKRLGKLTLHFLSPEENVLKIVIQDNGVGREVAAKLRRKNHKSRGMQIVKDKIDTLNISQDIKLSTVVEDLFGDKQIVEGTRVTITIEYKKNNYR